ncbi:MAG: hypothetical protein AAGG65_19225 [Pseudomonadota bacterium]
MILAGCAVSPRPGDTSLRDQVTVRQSCDAPEGFAERLGGQDRYRFTLEEGAVPAFHIFTGFNPGEALFFASSMWRAPDCTRITVITLSTQRPEDVEFLPVDDWTDIAGSDAVAALEMLRARCEALPGDEAIREFGNPPRRTADGRLVTTGESWFFNGCEGAVLSLAYAVRFRSPDGEIVVSNIYGDVFIEEII